MTYVFPPAAPVALPISGQSAVFPVRRVYCVGQNYAEHALEMGSDARQPPFFFSKPADSLVPGDGDIAYPPMTENFQHEVELVVALGVGGSNIPTEAALGCVFGYAIGFDMTRRDLQAAAKAKGRPWDMAKGFDQSAPVSSICSVAEVGYLQQGAIWLNVNGERRQTGDLSQMTWSVAEIIANLSQFVALAPGDLIFTGTPAGVSTVVRGDVLAGGIEEVGELEVRLV